MDDATMRTQSWDGRGKYLLHSAQERAALRRRCFGDMAVGEETSRGDWKEDMVDREKGHAEEEQGRAQRAEKGDKIPAAVTLSPLLRSPDPYRDPS
jgi:hypothetical protein